MSNITSQIVHLAMDAYGDRLSSVRGHVSNGDELDAMRAALEVAEAAWNKSSPEHQTDMLLTRAVLNQVVVPAAVPADRAPDTSRRQQAVETLLAMGWKWDHVSGWHAQPAEAADATRSLKWCAGVVQWATLERHIREVDFITLDDERRTIADILDEADAALAHTRPTADLPVVDILEQPNGEHQVRVTRDNMVFYAGIPFDDIEQAEFFAECVRLVIGLPDSDATVPTVEQAGEIGESGPTDRQGLREEIYGVLAGYRLHNWVDENAEAGYPLVDALSNGAGTIAPGLGELEFLAEAIAGQLEFSGAAALVSNLETPSFQARVSTWMDRCFLPSLYSNMTERGDRLLEEVLELLQSKGYDRTRVATLVDYVFGRPAGEPSQEVGGVMVTLAGYCWIAGLDMHTDGERELTRITQPEVMAKIRAKQEAKNALHFDTPVPGSVPEVQP